MGTGARIALAPSAWFGLDKVADAHAMAERRQNAKAIDILP
ncbi:hypothetical protein [Bordetella sp. H567]|nr:hypothetical protein [Bordetella sp. H567]